MNLYDPSLSPTEVSLWKNSMSRECREALEIIFKRNFPFWQMYLISDLLYVNGIPVMALTTMNFNCAMGMLSGSSAIFLNVELKYKGVTIILEGEVPTIMHGVDLACSLYKVTFQKLDGKKVHHAVS